MPSDVQHMDSIPKNPCNEFSNNLYLYRWVWKSIKKFCLIECHPKSYYHFPPEYIPLEIAILYSSIFFKCLHLGFVGIKSYAIQYFISQ